MKKKIGMLLFILIAFVFVAHATGTVISTGDPRQLEKMDELVDKFIKWLTGG